MIAACFCLRCDIETLSMEELVLRNAVTAMEGQLRLANSAEALAVRAARNAGKAADRATHRPGGCASSARKVIVWEGGGGG